MRKSARDGSGRRWPPFGSSAPRGPAPSVARLRRRTLEAGAAAGRSAAQTSRRAAVAPASVTRGGEAPRPGTHPGTQHRKRSVGAAYRATISPADRRNSRSAPAAGAWRTSARRLDLRSRRVRAAAIDVTDQGDASGTGAVRLLVREERGEDHCEHVAGRLRVPRAKRPPHGLNRLRLDQELVHPALERFAELGDRELLGSADRLWVGRRVGCDRRGSRYAHARALLQ